MERRPGQEDKTSAATRDEDTLVVLDDAEIDLPPPPYAGRRTSINTKTDCLGTKANFTDDGRVDLALKQRDDSLSRLLDSVVSQLDRLDDGVHDTAPPYTAPTATGKRDGANCPPPMNIVIQIVGSQGDVQPFVALAKILKNRFGHRVRLATHPKFRDFVQKHGIEFFSIGGDPHGLMAFMVKNPGLMPGLESLRKGDVTAQQKEVAGYLEGCWRSCFEPGDGLDPMRAREGTEGLVDDNASLTPFVADCIIANPPSFAHVHIAERLGIPLHIFFTMPYSPTQAFPHPLANIRQSDIKENLSNYMSYILVDMLTWQGLGGVINRFRKTSLGLEEISNMRAPAVLQRLKIPHTYAWSPALIEKPRDWGPTVDIAGFFFLDQDKDYSPPADLQAFLNNGPPPIYIGFGSIVLEDPDSMTELIMEAMRKTGQRALVSKGWGGMGGAEHTGTSSDVFLLDSVPHEWLFNHVSCVVHHGGAGTTSAGLAAGRPTVIVPFFGDQHFWGGVAARTGAGPEPIHNKSLTADNLAKAIMQCMEPQMQDRARQVASSITSDDGTFRGAESFHRWLDMEKMRCSVIPSRAAVWTIRGTSTRLSALAAHTLAREKLLDMNKIDLFRPCEYEIDAGSWEPFSGGTAAVVGTFVSMVTGLASMPKETFKVLQSPREGESAEEVPLSRTSTREDAKPGLRSNGGANRSMQAAAGAGKGLGRTVGAMMKAPMDFSVNMAKGFHNAPRLYGDDTVRKSERVVDFKSGLAAAGKGFGYGMYDGISGLVTQPVNSARKEGAVGALKGFGKGLGGFFFKPGAALFALPAYTMSGLYKQVRKYMGSSAESYIVTARLKQGFDEYQKASPDQRGEVLMQWEALGQQGR